MIAPIRESSPRESRRAAQRRKARRWIVESLLSRADTQARPTRRSGWQGWLCACWIVLVAIVYLTEILASYFGRG